MKDPFRELQLLQMDKLLDQWKAAQLGPRPRVGWVRAIREALGMSAAALARQMGITGGGLHKLETAEASDAITLVSLRKLAAALDCELHYVLLPRTSLTQHLRGRAEAVARNRLRPISHSMALEDQTVDQAQTNIQLELAIKSLLEGSRRDLW